MKPLRLGTAYHGNRMPRHAREDLLDIATHGMDLVVHMFSHTDWDRHKMVMKDIGGDDVNLVVNARKSLMINDTIVPPNSKPPAPRIEHFCAMFAITPSLSTMKSKRNTNEETNKLRCFSFWRPKMKKNAIIKGCFGGAHFETNYLLAFEGT